MKHMVHRRPSLTETAGLALVRTVVPGDAFFTDTGQLPNQHDWELRQEGVLVAAIEITSAQDRYRRSLTAALDKHWNWSNEVLLQPTLANRWHVNPREGCQFGKIRDDLVALLEELEANGITELRSPDEYRYRDSFEPQYATYYRWMLAQAERLNALGFLDVDSAPSGTATGGEIVAVVARTGAVASDASHLTHLAETTVADPNDHDLRKLANSGAAEGHLVIFIGDGDTFTFKGQPVSGFGAVRALRTRQLPATPVALPPRVGGLWFAPLSGNYPAAAYLRDGGWRFVDTADAWKDMYGPDGSASLSTS